MILFYIFKPTKKKLYQEQSQESVFS